MRASLLVSLLAFVYSSGALRANTVTGVIPDGIVGLVSLKPIVYWNFLANSGDNVTVTLTAAPHWINFPGSFFEIIDPVGQFFAAAFNNGPNHGSFLGPLAVPVTGDYEIGIFSTADFGYDYSLDVEGSTAGGELVFGNNPDLGPEPSSSALLALAVIGLGWMTRRRAFAARNS